MKAAFIAGVGGGVGEALAKACLESGYDVYGIDKKDSQILRTKMNYFFHAVNMDDTDMMQEYVKDFIDNHHFEIVVLNGGHLRDIEDLNESFLDDLRYIVNQNLWNTKQLIDCIDLHATVDQFVVLSAGASIAAEKGWGGYSISKAALTTMIKIYAEEKPWAHFSTIAPGIIMTPMLKRIFETTDLEIYPSIQRIMDGPILTPEHAAERLLSAFAAAKNYKSGSYLDIRTMEL